ncbi:bifunctional hydroxymethylpyrimidine kinase/phosphomethylpyrimidine kinase [Pseudoduganella armeniaca]|uniref:hydroxymethylpyrimidine kinase n=1 Tax=Pseudoduganella armeniaca TaxID=2072590 RepID=A0A2R4C6P1_9BURK|nr:hydroxymethylpyrimidine/phosphomethylpyrimidine kinase [Pseudoduganella armeniaca]AVR95279.1 hydroxymethylpyrimidine/phosphomethylpyrimidine kinase [Pseudoduganella armeniaca]
MQNQTSPLILTFGVADPIGAVGVHADLGVFAALGCQGLAVTTALLIGDSAKVEDQQHVEPDWVADQARAVLEDAQVAAFKIGALDHMEHISSIAEVVSDYPDAPLILDPFGSQLPPLGEDTDFEELLTVLRQLLVPQATLLMLSQVELGHIAETWRDLANGETMADDAQHLIDLGCEYVLVTGTPAGTSRAETGLRANTLYGDGGIVRHDRWQHLPGPFLGSGCTLSAAIAAYMAQGIEAPRAVQLAQQYTHGALQHARRFGMGKLVPDHFHALHAKVASLRDAPLAAPIGKQLGKSARTSTNPTNRTKQ